MTDPLDALSRIAAEIVALSEYLRGEVNRLSDLTYQYAADDQMGVAVREDVRAVVAAYERSLDRAARVLSTITKLDLHGQMLRLRSDELDMIVAAIRTAGRAIGLQAPAQRQLEAVMAKELGPPTPAGQPAITGPVARP